MSVSNQSITSVRKEMEELQIIKTPEEDIRKFTREFSRYVEQMKLDKLRLHMSGMPQEIYEKLITYDYLISRNVSDQSQFKLGEQKISPDFKSKMEKIGLYHNTLVIGIQFVIYETNDDTIRRAFTRLRRGDRHVDLLRECVGYASLIEEYLNVAENIRPGGTVIDQTYINHVRNAAVEMLESHGETLSAITDVSNLEDDQHRLVTLCMNGLEKLKMYARAAFLQDREYFKKHYTLPVGHEASMLKEKSKELNLV